MSRHWVPDENCVPLRLAGRPPLSAGAKAGLLLVAFACAGAVVGLNQLFAGADIVADEAAAADDGDWDQVALSLARHGDRSARAR